MSASPYAPVIDATGITAPDFPTLLAQLEADYLKIFGADTDIGNDTQDGQFIGIVAQAFADLNAAIVAAYNSQSPTTAVGNGLSSRVKINGLSRLVFTFSTALVTVVGVAQTPIQNGQATDTNGNTWDLPALVTIPNSGTINVLATCETPGAITAGIGTIINKKTPVFGWQTVNNAVAATPGAPVESDAALRLRQSQSVELPAQTIFQSIVANLKTVLGVTRVGPYENNTGSTNALGIAAHTLAFIVEGGTNQNIWNAIAAKIAPGIPTAGAQSTTLVDPVTGSTRAINFDRPTDDTITVAVTVKALNGWSTATEALIAQAIVNYINAAPIGQNLSYTAIIVVAYLLGTALNGSFSITNLTLAKNGGSAAAADISIAYNEAPVAVVGGVTFTVT